MKKADDTQTRLKDAIISHQLGFSFVLTVALWAVDHFVWSGKGLSSLVHDVRKETYSALATIFGALLGFVLTALSIVVTLGSSSVIRKLRESNDFCVVVRAFMQAVYTLGLGTLVALSAIFLDCKDTPFTAVEYAVFFITIASLAAFISVSFVLEMLVLASNE